MREKVSKYIKVTVINAVLALVVLVPGAIVTKGQVAAYAECVFIPLAALVMFTVTSFKLDEKRAGCVSAGVITLAAHAVLAGFKPIGFLFVFLYAAVALFGYFLGFLGRKMS